MGAIVMTCSVCGLSQEDHAAQAHPFTSRDDPKIEIKYDPGSRALDVNVVGRSHLWNTGLTAMCVVEFDGQQFTPEVRRRIAVYAGRVVRIKP